jgi:hypothetical protein
VGRAGESIKKTQRMKNADKNKTPFFMEPLLQIVGHAPHKNSLPVLPNTCPGRQDVPEFL